MKNNSLIIPFLLFIISLILRYNLISLGPYHADCLFFAMNVQASLTNYNFTAGWPLSTLLGVVFHVILKMFGQADPVSAVNLMSVVLSSLCVPVFYTVAKKLFEQRTALIAALFLSASPIGLGISTYGNSHIPSLLFLLIGISKLLNFLKTQRTRDLYLTGLFLGFSGAARLADLAITLPPLILLFLFYRPAKADDTFRQTTKPNLKAFLMISGICALVIGLFYLPSLLKNRTTFSTTTIYDVLHHEIFVAYIGLSKFYAAKTFQYLLIDTSYLGAVLFGFGFVLLMKKDKNLSLILLLWALLPPVIYSTLDICVPRFLMPSLLPIYMIIGFLLSRMMNYKYYFLGAALVLFFILIAANFTYIFPILKFRHHNALLPAFAEWVGQVTEPKARVICMDERLFIHWYGKRGSLSRPVHHVERIKDADLQEFQNTLDDLLRQRIPVYITQTALYTYNPDHQFSDFIKNRYTLEYKGKKPVEDWHRGDIFVIIVPVSVYQIHPG